MATIFKPEEREFHENANRIDNFKLFTDISRIKKGINPEYLNFDVRKLNDFVQGTGLGLAISKAIAEAAGGKVGFSSEAGVGSTFWAWFPCDVDL